MNPAYPVPDYRPCQHCDDLGVVRVAENDSKHKSLMRCDCKEGTLQTYQLPQWEWKWGKLYHRTKCPIEWFRPDDAPNRHGRPVSMQDAMWTKIVEWRQIIKLYEDYWVSAAAEFKAGK